MPEATAGRRRRALSRHAGIPATDAEREASRKAAVKHGFFFSGFLREDERELYERIATWGEVDSWALKRELIAALLVRAARMTRWESEDGEASPHTAAAYKQLQQTLEKFGFGALLTRPPPHADPPKELLRDSDRALLRRMLMPEETEDEESGGQEQEG